MTSQNQNHWIIGTEGSGDATTLLTAARPSLNLAPMDDDVLGQLLRFISFSFMVEPDDIALDKSMVDEGIIDSFGLVEIAAFLDDRYGIKVQESDLTRENFGSVLKIVAFTQRRRVR